jgi:hypothetical protein
MTAAENPALDGALRGAIRPAQVLAWTLLAGLPVLLAFEELLRSRFRPFLGFARLSDRLSFRYGFYLAAAAAIVVIRVLNAAGLRRKKPVSPEAHLGRLKTMALLTLAVADAPALLGFALFLAGGYNLDFYILMFVSLVLLFMYFPRPRAWEAHLQNAPPACSF